MKKSFYLLFSLVLGLATFTSCETDPLVYDARFDVTYPYDRPVVILNPDTAGFMSYYIRVDAGKKEIIGFAGLDDIYVSYDGNIDQAAPRHIETLCNKEFKVTSRDPFCFESDSMKYTTRKNTPGFISTWKLDASPSYQGIGYASYSKVGRMDNVNYLKKYDDKNYEQLELEYTYSFVGNDTLITEMKKYNKVIKNDSCIYDVVWHYQFSYDQSIGDSLKNYAKQYIPEFYHDDFPNEVKEMYLLGLFGYGSDLLPSGYIATPTILRGDVRFSKTSALMVYGRNTTTSLIDRISEYRSDRKDFTHQFGYTTLRKELP